MVVAFSFGRNSGDAYPKQHTVESFAEFAAYVCDHRSREKGEKYFCAPFAANGDGRHHRGKDNTLPRAWLPLDLDHIESSETMADLLLALQPWRHFAYTTSSHSATAPRLRIVAELSREVDRDEGQRCGLAFQRDLLAAARITNGAVKFDESVYRAEQPCFGPLTHADIYPRDRRMAGAPIDVDALLAKAPDVEPTVTAKDRAERIAHEDPLVKHLAEHGYLLNAPAPDGKLAIRCPNEQAHSETTSPTSTVVLLPHFNGVAKAVIKCLHASCADVTQAEFLRLAGYGAREDTPTGPPLPLIWAKDAGPMLDAPYVVKGVVGPGELVVVYGAPKSGKTFFATDLALHVAFGLSWLEHRVRQGLVVYVASEMGKRAGRRVWAWCDRHLGDEADHDIPFAIVPKVVNLLNELDVEHLVITLESLIATRGKPALIVFDTLARSMSGGDENSAQDMGRAVAVADRLRDQFGTATVLVHHAGKDVTKGSRGSSALLGAADCYILIEADQAGGHVATVEWCRDGEAGRRHGFRLHQVELGSDSDGDPATTCVLVPSDEAATKPVKPVRRDVALEALREEISEHGEVAPMMPTIPDGTKSVTLDQWRTRWALRTGYEDSSGNSIAVNFHKDKDALLKAGKVSISKPYVWPND